MVVTKEGSGHTGDPGGEETNGGRGHSMDHFGMSIGENVDLGITRSQVREGCGMILATFDVEYVNQDG